MTFKQMSNLPQIAAGSRISGYNGELIAVTWRFDVNTGKTFVHHSMGFCTENIPSAIDATEAFNSLVHHPNMIGNKLTSI